MFRRGFSIVELILALALIAMAFMVFMSIFSSSSRQSVQSRNRTCAILLANSLMDELEAHPYGAVAPKGWASPVDVPVRVWVEGRQQVMEFHKKLDYQNGSFIGGGAGDSDLVTLTISWREGAGTRQAPVVVPEDDKMLTVQVPLWR